MYLHCFVSHHCVSCYRAPAFRVVRPRIFNQLAHTSFEDNLNDDGYMEAMEKAEKQSEDETEDETKPLVDSNDKLRPEVFFSIKFFLPIYNLSDFSLASAGRPSSLFLHVA